MAAKNIKVTPTSDQLGMVLGDIAESAQSIRRLALGIRESEDTRDAGAWRHAIEALAERIGLLADLTADSLPTVFGPRVGAQATDWMMPPAWHYAVEKTNESEVAHG